MRKTQRGDIVIYSELALPPKPDYSGSLTKRTATRRLGRVTETPQNHCEVTGAGTEIYATIEYEDNNGRQIYEMTKNQIVIGRGGSDYWTDLTLHTLAGPLEWHPRSGYRPPVREPWTGRG